MVQFIYIFEKRRIPSNKRRRINNGIVAVVVVIVAVRETKMIQTEMKIGRRRKSI